MGDRGPAIAGFLRGLAMICCGHDGGWMNARIVMKR